MLEINHYTASFDDQIRPQVPLRAGQYVRIHDSADAREYDAFNRRLHENGLMIGKFVRWHPRLMMNVFKIEKDTSNV